jgi:hypothetical protein
LAEKHQTPLVKVDMLKNIPHGLKRALSKAEFRQRVLRIIVWQGGKIISKDLCRL